MKFSIIYQPRMARLRFLDVDSESLKALMKKDLRKKIDPRSGYVYGVVDYEGQRVIPAAMTSSGMIVEVPDGDFGELTTAEQLMEIQEIAE